MAVIFLNGHYQKITTNEDSITNCVDKTLLTQKWDTTKMQGFLYDPIWVYIKGLAKDFGL